MKKSNKPVYLPFRICGYVPAESFRKNRIQSFFSDWQGRTQDIQNASSAADDLELSLLIDCVGKDDPKNQPNSPYWPILVNFAVSMATVACDVATSAPMIAFRETCEALIRSISSHSEMIQSHQSQAFFKVKSLRDYVLRKNSRIANHLALHACGEPYSQTCFQNNEWGLFLSGFRNCEAFRIIQDVIRFEGDPNVEESCKVRRFCPILLSAASHLAISCANATPERGANPAAAEKLKSDYRKFMRTVRASIEMASRLS